ncbi:MAG: tail fiber domain-containing protein [Candidatus Niyogibacteria bacterium]|nr:tail fiber domain-containing protein [Candidatus Niyogibacteria bacterium]
MRLKGGNVGIGTVSPSYKLDVNGTIRNTGFPGAGIIGSGSSYAVQGFGGTTGVYGTGQWYGVYGAGALTGSTGVYGQASSDGGYGVYGYGGNSGVFGNSSTVGVSGVGGDIGVSGAGSIYGVYGQSNSYGVYGFGANGVRGQSSDGWGVWCQADSSAGCGGNKAWTSSSDARLKTNISTITGALEKVLKLRGVNYVWKEDATNENHIGFIAQEVLPVVPEVVGQDNKTGYYNITLGEMTPLLVEAVKELKAENDLLKGRVDELETKINNLKK